jgi:aspartyl-tRNA(Asn)/glutamyl-tRNA(Gln) amidotransferase subunit B
MPYRPTIGLEVHAELATKTKMFCASKNDADETRPNVNICPVCLAHPGTLPVINKQAVHHVLRVGAAVGGTLADYSEFDRKSYFYPDIPKGYQISQYEHPLVSGGELAGVAITRVHLEEDTARSSHSGGTSLVDFNRAGVPLMELVTEPVIRDAQTAGKFARELQLLLRALGASEANLEKGEMRIEANISVSAGEKFGTKVEVKNLNSFRSVERAIAYEIARQSKLLDEGGRVTQETRGWDEGKQQTFSQRLKEGSADYRYFPEPDLPKMLRSDMPEWSDDALAASLPELPAARRARYIELGLKPDDADFFVREQTFGKFFERACDGAESSLVLLIANYIVSDLAGMFDRGEVSQEWLLIVSNATRFNALMRLIQNAELSSRGAKDVLAFMVTTQEEPRDIAKIHGLLQVHNEEELGGVVESVITANQAVVADYRAGKEEALQYLVGQAMKATKGAGNPAVLRQLLLNALKSSV